MFRDYYCRECGCRDGVAERFSLGVYYALLCDRCWEKAPVRKEGADAFDPLDAGEALEPEDGEVW
jgi:hypothetical protein